MVNTCKSYALHVPVQLANPDQLPEFGIELEL